ncbi:Glycosyltransferase [Rhodovastum atsumiense]|uniref:Glycosyltransferase n=3 Tax=Rhodovastum atsumiense TaxID=504468 RepID=A0A5M6IKZ4_9PROT|nr:glycosyltransferase family 4 protein [Rhodovastum atsumiense]KAA5608941.1 glycosyltransferase [Rhodovastum atsumiense]CAH2604201.1 Glycosyltransferase [Rhodovastum atsumiense]
MKYLLIHQNMPGQFRHLAPALARNPTNQVVFMTRRSDVTLPGVQRLTYAPTRVASASTHHYVRLYENCVLHGQQVVRACLKLANEGFRPDMIIAHPGWGESLFVKDVFPDAKLLNYCEFYYHGHGADVGFDPASPASMDSICRARARNAHLLLSLEACDHGISPTHWQRDRHPEPFRHKISVIFDGVDTDMVHPDPEARFILPDGRALMARDEVVTYVARNLEPYRGFPSFMRAVPQILRARPEARIVIIGGDEISYGHAPSGHTTWREAMLAEVGPLDPDRVHILPRIPYASYLTLLQVSAAHVYLTVPFVLSWSCMETLAAGCLVVGSRTPPVEEVIEDGHNGVLVDFFAPDQIAARVADCLADRAGQDSLRRRARETVLERYALNRCLPAQLRLIESLVA